MSEAHILQLPKAVFILKIAQIVLSVIILGLSAYVIYIDDLGGISTAFGPGNSFAIFTAIYTKLTIVYFLVATFAIKALYNWIAILILECLGVIFWLCTWAVLAAYFVLWKAYVCYPYDDCSGIQNEAEANPAFGAYVGGWEASIVLSVVVFILYCVTLGFIGAGIHRHRKAGKPITASSSSSSASNTWTYGDKSGGVNMPEIQPYHAQSSYPEYVQPKVQPGNVSYNQVPSPGSTYSQPTPVNGYGMPNGGGLNSHGVYGGTRYA